NQALSHYRSRTRLFHTAVGNSTGDTVIYDCEDEDGSPYASFYKEAIEDIRERRAVVHSVKVDTLDNLIPQEHVDNIVFIKIDTEGAEKDVLLGATKVLNSASLKFIQIEFNEMNASGTTFL